MSQLLYTGNLKAVVVPHDCNEFENGLRQLLSTTDVPVVQVNKENFSLKIKEILQKYKINIGLVLTFSLLIPKEIFELPEKGFFNVHPGFLPSYRGSDPIFYQIKNREKFAAVAIHKLTEGFDDGEIVLQEKITLHSTYTYGLLELKLSRLAQKQVEILIKILSLGFAVPSKSQDESRARYYGRQQNKELLIEWDKMNAHEIIALINACNPYNNGAATSVGKKLVKFLTAEVIEFNNNRNTLPGEIVAIDDEWLEIATIKKGELLKVFFIYIEEGYVQPSVLKQWGILPGTCFENLVF
ncbi:MAG TPA: formyltransferase family protein [Chitinophagaceae bacterium]|nr:formyltransferase family protein [Chitinophagaceae bacterium]